MMTPCEELTSIINEKEKVIGTTYNAPSYHAIQNIIRCIDSILPFQLMQSKTRNGKERREFVELIKFGWPRLLKPYYFDINITKLVPFPIMGKDMIKWGISNLIYTGKIEFCKQLLSYEKANLLKINKDSDLHYSFTYIDKYAGIETFDRASLDFYREKLVKKIIEDRRKNDCFNIEEINAEFAHLIANPFGELISYDTSPQIDEYYSKEGHYRLLMMQGYDDFDGNDYFGGIPYHKYITIIEEIIGIAIKHTNACIIPSHV